MFIVVDNNVNSSNCMAIVMVVDNIVFQALCQDFIVQLDDFGEGFFIVGQVNNGFSDVCGIVMLNLSKMEFSCDDVGFQNVMFIVIDNNGNSSICIVNIIVEDNIVLVVECQDLMIQLGMNGLASIIVVDIENGFMDVCGVLGLVLNIIIFGIVDVGDNIVMFIVIDDNDNSSICIVIVIVENNFVFLIGGIGSNFS